METMERLFGAEAPKAEELPVEVTEPVLPAAPAPEAEPPAEGSVAAAPPVEAVEPQAPEPSVPDPNKQPLTPEMLGAVLGERERRKEAERQLENLRKQVERFEAKERETTENVPDPVVDPAAYHAFQQQQAAQSEWNVVRRISSVMAAQTHGQELVQKAVEWWDQKVSANPALGNEIMRQAHPYDYAVQQYKRDQDLQRLEGKSLDDWFAAEVARRGLAAGGGAIAPAIPPVPPPVMPPRSMASVPNAMLPGPVAYERTKTMNRLMGDG